MTLGVDVARTARWAAAALVVGWAAIGAATQSDAQAQLIVTPVAAVVGILIVLGRRHPIVCVLGAFAGLMIGSGAGGREAENAFLIGLIVASFLAGRYARLAHLPWLGAVVLLMVSGAVVDNSAGPGDAVFPLLFTVGPCLVGVAVQLAASREHHANTRAELLDAMRSEEVRRTAAEERLRIARDLHDVVAHDISAVSLQAQVARRAAEAGRAVDPASLREIEESAQRAMNDARRLLGLLRVDDDATTSPAPELTDVDALVDQLAGLGQEVQVDKVGDIRPLPPALSQAAFRIVQEALTNARRHGAGGPTRLGFDWGLSQLRMTVSNAIRNAGPADPGHGTAGIVERAALFGGEATIGPCDDRWVVDVVLPVPAVAS